MLSNRHAPNTLTLWPLKKWLGLLFSTGLVSVIVWQWGNALGIEIKARFAQVLIEQAWQRQLQTPEQPVHPWPWADTHPVGRLQWLDGDRKVKQDLYTLAGADGSSLAFGPGQMNGLGESQTKVLAGHRDTHFAFLQHVQNGDQLRWQGRDGTWRSYVVRQISIADSDHEELLVDPEMDALWLVTCYPFDALQAGGPLRYLVKAEPVAFQQEIASPQTYRM